MKAIEDYAGVTDVTILAWVRSLGFPATKVAGGWESTSEDIEQWRMRQRIINSPGGVAIQEQFDRLERRIAKLESALAARGRRE